MGNKTFSTFGDLLKTLRKQRHLTQNELAYRIGVHRNTIGTWEHGDFLPESKTIVLELAHQLHLDTYDTQRLLEASLTAISPYWHVPHQRNPFFTGREHVLEQLHAGLAYEYASALSCSYALSGLGGIGKTQTAIEYVYRYASDYAAVFWIRADTNERIHSSFLAVAELLCLPERLEHDCYKVVAGVHRWLSNHSQWLVVFDNVEDIELVERLLPPARRGALLLTTRRQALGAAARIIHLGKMNMEECVLFLLQRAKILSPGASSVSFSSTTLAVAQEIVTPLDGLPLAIDQAGAYIEETGCRLLDYLDRYQLHQALLLNRRGSLSVDHPESVDTTLSLSLEKVERESPTAIDMLRLCAFLGADDIPEEIIMHGMPEADAVTFDEALAVLRTYSLLQRHSETRALSVHRLVQVVLKEKMDQQMQSLWVERAVWSMNRAFSDAKEVALWPHYQQYLPHVEACVILMEQWKIISIDAAQLLNQVGVYLHECGLSMQAERFLCLARDMWVQAEGEEHLSVAHCLSNLAWLYRSQKRYVEAEPLFLRALTIREQQLGSLHPGVGEILNNLAVLYWRQKRYTEAEPYFLRALKIKEQQFGSDHFHVAFILNNIALLYRDQVKYSEAEVLFLKSLVIFEQLCGPVHPHVFRILHNIAVLYYNQGRYAEAEAFFLRVHINSEPFWGPGHPDRALNLEKLATLYCDQGRYTEAEPLLLQAVDIREQQVGLEHPAVASSLENYAHLLRETNRSTSTPELEAPIQPVHVQSAAS